ncbi:hypothetical protein D9M68_308240 [compost metagenome]
MLEVQLESVGEVGRQPEQHEPPDWIGDELANDEGPGLLHAQQGGPAHFRGGLLGLDRILLDEAQLLDADPRVMLGKLVHR